MTNDVLSLTQFEGELRRGLQMPPQTPSSNVLSDVVEHIKQNPAFAQSRLLTRVLAALVNKTGDFRRAEISTFDSKTRALVLALMQTYAAGTTAQDDWHRALAGVMAI